MNVDSFWAVCAVFMRVIGSGSRCGCTCLYNLVYVFVSSHFFIPGTLLATGKLKPGTARGRRKQQLGLQGR